MVLQMVNPDGIAINVDPATVERVAETEAAGVCHLIIAGQEIPVRGDAEMEAARIRDARGIDCPVWKLLPPDPPLEADLPPDPPLEADLPPDPPLELEKPADTGTETAILEAPNPPEG